MQVKAAVYIYIYIFFFSLSLSFFWLLLVFGVLAAQNAARLFCFDFWLGNGACLFGLFGI